MIGTWDAETRRSGLGFLFFSGLCRFVVSDVVGHVGQVGPSEVYLYLCMYVCVFFLFSLSFYYVIINLRVFQSPPLSCLSSKVL
jgi:hypothetical protein